MIKIAKKKRKYKSALSEMSQVAGRTMGLISIRSNRISEKIGIRKKKKRK